MTHEFADLWERLMHNSGDYVGKTQVADKKERVSSSGERGAFFNERNSADVSLPGFQVKKVKEIEDE